MRDLEFRISGGNRQATGYYEYTRLANAIVEKAVDDYRSAAVRPVPPRLSGSEPHQFVETVRKNYLDRLRKKEGEKKHIRNFINSKWYRILTGVPASILLKHLDEIDAAAM